MVYNIFEKKSSGGDTEKEIMLNQELTEELNKPIIKELEKHKIYSSFKDNIWGADLADMQLKNNSFFTMHAWYL